MSMRTTSGRMRPGWTGTGTHLGGQNERDHRRPRSVQLRSASILSRRRRRRQYSPSRRIQTLDQLLHLPHLNVLLCSILTHPCLLSSFFKILDLSAFSFTCTPKGRNGTGDDDEKGGSVSTDRFLPTAASTGKLTDVKIWSRGWCQTRVSDVSLRCSSEPRGGAHHEIYLSMSKDP
jgi:hypothetical protein